MSVHFSGMIASTVRYFLNRSGCTADQPQSNGCFGIHQMRVRLPEDRNTYRVIICPADAPLFIGKMPIDEHFLESIKEHPASPDVDDRDRDSGIVNNEKDSEDQTNRHSQLHLSTEGAHAPSDGAASSEAR